MGILIKYQLLDFLMGRHQVVRVCNYPSATLTLNTWAPQRFVISHLLYSLFTHDSNTIIKFADGNDGGRADHRRR